MEPRMTDRPDLAKRDIKDWPMDEEHEAMLLRLTGQDVNGILPDRIREIYWELRRIGDPIRARIEPITLALIVMLANDAPKPPPESFFDETDVKRDDPVVVKFRGRYRLARWIANNLHEKKVIAALEDDGEERRFSPTNVRKATEADLAAVGAA